LGRFHHTYFANQKVSGSPKIRSSISPMMKKHQISSLNYCTFCQTLFPICPIWAPKKAFHPVHPKKYREYVDEIDT